jgi:hypothetical protein
MENLSRIQVGDIVRVRQTLELIPIHRNSTAPTEVPSGIFGEVTDVFQMDGDIYYQVQFHEPYEYVNELPLPSETLEIMFRFSMN